MNLHLHWDEQINEGMINNDRYNHCSIKGIENKPTLSFEFTSISYSELYPSPPFKHINGLPVEMTPEEIEEVKIVARDWVQALGQQGNYTLEQQREIDLREIQKSFGAGIFKMHGSTVHETQSWNAQESEARAYLSDNTTITPFIDVLLLNRNQNETKDELVNKILVKADEFKAAYAKKLGEYQKAIKDIENAQDIETLNNIIYTI